MDRQSTGHDTRPSALPAHRRSARNNGALAVLTLLVTSLAIIGLTWLLGGLG